MRMKRYWRKLYKIVNLIAKDFKEYMGKRE